MVVKKHGQSKEKSITDTETDEGQDKTKENQFIPSNMPVEPKSRVSAIGLVVFDDKGQVGELDPLCLC